MIDEEDELTNQILRDTIYQRDSMIGDLHTEIVRLNNLVSNQIIEIEELKREKLKNFSLGLQKGSLVYLAHPVAGAVESNVEEAKRLLRSYQDANPDLVILAPWITDVEIYDDSIPEYRRAGLERCKLIIDRCDYLLLTGDRISEGMKEEMEGLEDNAVINRTGDL